MVVVFLSKPILRVRVRPARNVHEMADALAHALEDLHHAELEIESVGMGLYHVMPPELVTALESRKAMEYCDVD